MYEFDETMDVYANESFWFHQDTLRFIVDGYGYISRGLSSLFCSIRNLYSHRSNRLQSTERYKTLNTPFSLSRYTDFKPLRSSITSWTRLTQTVGIRMVLLK